MTRGQEDLFDNALGRARSLKAKRRYPEAMKVLTQELKRRPHDLKIKASLADLYYRTSHYREALALSGEILRDDPNEPSALVVMGNVLLARKKPKEAVDYFELALQVAETDYLWARMARCYLETREPDKAMKAIERGESFQPDGREFLRLRIELAWLNRDEQAEREAYERAARAAPADLLGFANFMLYLFSDLVPRKAACASEKIRQTPGQTLNPYLLLFESEALAKSRDPSSALTRLHLLLSQSLPEAMRSQANELREELETRVSHQKSLPTKPSTTDQDP